MNGNGNGTVTRWLIGVLTVVSASGIMGMIGMYGQVQNIMARMDDQRREIYGFDARLRACENIMGRR